MDFKHPFQPGQRPLAACVLPREPFQRLTEKDQKGKKKKRLGERLLYSVVAAADSSLGIQRSPNVAIQRTEILHEE